MNLKIISAASLKRKLKSGGFTNEEGIYVRLHRAISWIKASEENPDNIDLKFICLWIAFNSCYAEDPNSTPDKTEYKKEKQNYTAFLEKIDTLNKSEELYYFLWNRFSNEVKSIVENKYLSQRYWDSIKKNQTFNEDLLQKLLATAFRNLENKETTKILTIVLDNLYVLRNQIIHGYATYGSMVNRIQIKHGITILQSILPIIIETMIENHTENWGVLNYPVINKEKFFK